MTKSPNTYLSYFAIKADFINQFLLEKCFIFF